MQTKSNIAKTALVTGSIIAGTVLSSVANAATPSSFSFRALGNGSAVRSVLSNTAHSMNLDLNCAAKTKDSTCGAKKKDDSMSKTKDGKCGEGKCGGKKKEGKKKGNN